MDARGDERAGERTDGRPGEEAGSSGARHDQPADRPGAEAGGSGAKDAGSSKAHEAGKSMPQPRRRLARAWLVLPCLALFACAHAPRSAEGDRTALRKAMAARALQAGDHAGAMEILRDLYLSAPEDPDVLAMRGVALREQGLLAEAKTELREAVRRAPSSAFAHSNLGVLLDQAGEREEALEHHRRAATLAPRSAAYLNNLGFALFLRGKPAEAIEQYQLALRLDGGDARTRNNLGFAYARSGNFARAAEQFGHAGTPSEARNNLGFAYELEGNWAQAWAAYVEAVALDGKAERPRKNLAHLASRMGKTPPAETRADERKEQAP